MKLSRTVTYAIQATLQLAESNSQAPIPCRRLAAEGDMPERFLLQILRSLVNHGILQSTRGVDGGYTLTKPPDKISVLDVIEAIEGPIDEGPRLEHASHTSTHERLEAVLQHVSLVAQQQLRAIKLSQIVRPKP